MDLNEQEPVKNENNVDQGVSIEKLLQIIGLRDVELVMHEEATNKIKEQALGIMKQNATLMEQISVLKSENDALKKKAAEPIPPPVESPETLQLRKANETGDIRVKQLESQTHAVAIERDEAKKESLRFAGLAKDLQGLLDEANQKNVVLVTEKVELVKERNDLVALVQKKKGKVKE